MWPRALILTALVVSLQGVASIGASLAHNATSSRPVNRTLIIQTIVGHSNATAAPPTDEALETAPSITSVHQVWTASSSGSLDELSPETISKLRNDVPFLAAYALRPRLVGALPAPMMSPVEHKLDTSSSDQSALVVADGGPRGQTGADSPVSRLGDFSEFKVETSSTSKSEHHHRRKTSLKRQPPDDDAEEAAGRGRPSRLAKSKNKKQIRQASRKGLGTSRRKSKTRRAGRTKSKVALNRLRAGKAKLAKSGRLFQESPVESKADSGESQVEMRVPGRDDAIMPSTNELDGGKTSGVKGGAGAKKTPFFASKRPIAEPHDENDLDRDEGLTTEIGKRGSSSGGGGSTGDSSVESTTGNPEERDEDVGELDDEPQPRRVGDDDVEEEGDTVLVEPKSDGVEDDPPLPDEDPALGADEAGDDLPAPPGQGDGRGKRVDRDRPNEAPGNREEADEASDDGNRDSGSVGQAAGGGIGATIGGSGGRTGSSGAPGGANDGTSSRESGGGGGGGGGEPGTSGAGRGSEGSPRMSTPGVEFANDYEDDERDRASVGAGKTGGEFGERRGRMSTARPRGSGERGPEMDDEDLDYRDELPGPNDGSRRGADEGRDERQGGGGKKESGSGGNLPAPSGDGGHARDDHCNDDSHGHDHHDHHDTIDWLRGAIPGEPDDDYPILNRVNGSNFKCSEQKHPGYYADVESRCQIFHICQADGRQDSFLCPNGTIFSQKTLVCVWWNGFSCKDAPKLYHLNELLYKATDGNESPQSPALPAFTMGPGDGSAGRPIGALRPRAMAHDGAEADGDSSIEGLVRMMRGRGASSPRETEAIDDETGLKENGGGGGGARGASNTPARRGGESKGASGRRLKPDDEATIQRKSTNLDDDAAGFPETGQSASRIRARENIPRRERRSSYRQAPLKLKSRRVPRNSRRRKLRHGVKPRRRA